jgi:hypothetical protein
MGRNRQRWEKIFSFAGLIDYERLYRPRGFNAGARERVLFGHTEMELAEEADGLEAHFSVRSVSRR